MPLTNAQIHEIEQRLETAAVAALTTAGLTPAYTTRADGTLPAQRIVAEASGFAIASEQMAFSVDGQPFHNHYQGTLTFIVTTRRVGGSAQHATWLGAIRVLCLRPTQAFAGVLEGAEILRLVQDGAPVSIDTEREYDKTEISYEIDIGIKGSAVDFSA